MGPSFGGLVSEPALAFIQTQFTPLKMAVMRRRSEPRGGFLPAYSVGSLYLFISRPWTWETEQKDTRLITVVLSVVISVMTKIFISVITCVNKVALLT